MNKKLLSIIIFSLLWCNISFGQIPEDQIKYGIKQVAWYYEGLYKEFAKHLKGHKVLKENYLSVVKEIKKASK